MDDVRACITLWPETGSNGSISPMWIVAIAWMYVALMMTIAEATASNGTLLGAVITLLLYGIGPVSLVMYLLNTPARRRARRAAEAREQGATSGADDGADLEDASSMAAPNATSGFTPDEGGLTSGDAVASE